MMRGKARFWRFFYFALLLLWIAFIFSNSLRNATVSGAQSSALLSDLNRMLDWLHIPAFLHPTHHFIRKCAHFIEYAVLGILTYGAVLQSRYTEFWGCIPAVWFSFSIACTDEFLQHFSAGRSPQLSDALLDGAGAWTGILLLYLLVWWMRKQQKKQKSGAFQTTKSRE